MDNPTKPTGVLELNETHPDFSRLLNYFVFGMDTGGPEASQVIDLVNPGTTITTSAPFVDDPDLGRCLEMSDTGHGLFVGGSPLTMPFQDGESTVVVIAKIVGGSRGSGPDWKLFYAQPDSASRYDVELFVHRELNPRVEWGNSLVNFTTPDIADTPELEAMRAFAWSIADGVSHAVTDGLIDEPLASQDTDGIGTDAGSMDVNVLPPDDLTAGVQYRIAAIINLSGYSSPTALNTNKDNPYSFVSGDPVFNIASTVPADLTGVVPGTQITLNVANVNGGSVASLELAGQPLPIDSQSITDGDGTVLVTIPDPVTFGDQSLEFLAAYSIVALDAEGNDGVADLSIALPPGDWQLVNIVNPWFGPESLLLDDEATAETGNRYIARVLSGDPGGPVVFPQNGDPSYMNFPEGVYVLEIAVYQEYQGVLQWSGYGQRTLTSGDPGVTILGATVSPDSSVVLVQFSEPMVIGAGGSDGLELLISWGDVELTYVSGAGTDIFECTPSRVIRRNESGSITYNTVADGIETESGEDLPNVLSAPLDNQSTVPEVIPTITLQPTPQTVPNGQLATFTVAASTGGQADPITYQWLANGAPIAGATAASYSVTASLTGNNGVTYACVVTSAQAGEVQSNDAVLTVTAPTTRIVSLQLVDRSGATPVIMAGQAINYRVRSAAGALVAQGTANTDASGFLDITSTQFGAVGELVSFEVLHPGGSYTGFPVTLVGA